MLTESQIRKKLPSHLKYYPIPYGSERWHAFRRTGIGGSEIGVLLGMNPYTSIMEVYHQKIGTMLPAKTEFERMWHGRMLEPYIANTCWRYYDGYENSHVVNHSQNRPIRDNFQVPGYIVNPKYPWLFISPDFFIDKDGLRGGMNLINMQPLKKHGILETKNLSYWGGKVWEDGYPGYWIPQVQDYMLVGEADYAEIAFLYDGNEFRVEKVLPDEALQQRILQVSKAFWENHVVPGQQAKKAFDQADQLNDYDSMEKAMALIHKFEPEPDGTEYYKEFLSYNFSKKREMVNAPEAVYEMAKQHKMCSEMIKQMIVVRKKLEQYIAVEHNREESEYLHFDGKGFTRYFKKKNNKNYELNNQVAPLPDFRDVMRQLDKLELDYE